MNLANIIFTFCLLTVFTVIAIHVDKSVKKKRKVSYRGNRSRITWL